MQRHPDATSMKPAAMGST
ncbi:mCG1042847, isoform CRA_a [Mus musculus]|nr:mCG1042847, isoform CRA_a [Mus musculus]